MDGENTLIKTPEPKCVRQCLWVCMRRWHVQCKVNILCVQNQAVQTGTPNTLDLLHTHTHLCVCVWGVWGGWQHWACVHMSVKARDQPSVLLLKSIHFVFLTRSFWRSGSLIRLEEQAGKSQAPSCLQRKCELPGLPFTWVLGIQVMFCHVMLDKSFTDGTISQCFFTHFTWK